ncbi:MAG: alpha-L-fucosidase [Phycisphaerae bacterium]|nr:alpha-L-fucosidase [Phycisphaerae bacterium]
MSSEAYAASILALLVLGVGRPAFAADRADWFHGAKWGVLTHYLGAAPSSDGGAELTAKQWNAQVDAFDVDGLVKQLASTGTRYYVITIGQNSGHYCSPNATYDKIVGIRPSKCSRRDLVKDLYEALAPHGIRLMVYLPSGAPAADPVAVRKLKWAWGRADGWPRGGALTHDRLVEFQRNWEAVIREWSKRWGRHVHGWWIDGCYFADDMYRFEDAPNFASFAAALRAGNPDAIVAFNPGVKIPVVCHTKYEDYTAGEVGLSDLPRAIESCGGRWIERDGKKNQYHILTFLGKTWCGGERPELPDEKIIGYTRQITDRGGVVTYDVPIMKNGLIPQPFVEQLRAIGRAFAAEPK